jgi:spermidine/putrescine-binding protein
MMNLFMKTVISAATAVTLSGTAFAADPELVVFEWAGYEDENFIQKYIDQHGDSPTYSFFSDEEEVFQKIRAGFKADVGHPCAQSVVKWRNAGIIEPIDTSRLTHWDKLISTFKDLDGFKVDGEQWVVPVDWGTTALTYRTDVVSEEEASTLQSFTDPKWVGRISVVDNVDDAYALGFLATGIQDWNKADMDDLKKASDFLRKVHKNVRTYWQDPAEARTLMTTGEIALSWAWNEVAVVLADEGHPVALNRDVKEGSSTWICGYTVLKDGNGSKDKAYDFLNAWLEESSAEYMVTEWGYGHSRADVMDAIGAENGFGTVESYSQNTLSQSPIQDSDLREAMVKEFELIKAGF